MILISDFPYELRCSWRPMWCVANSHEVESSRLEEVVWIWWGHVTSQPIAFGESCLESRDSIRFFGESCLESRDSCEFDVMWCYSLLRGMWMWCDVMLQPIAFGESCLESRDSRNASHFIEMTRRMHYTSHYSRRLAECITEVADWNDSPNAGDSIQWLVTAYCIQRCYSLLHLESRRVITVGDSHSASHYSRRTTVGEEFWKWLAECITEVADCNDSPNAGDAIGCNIAECNRL